MRLTAAAMPLTEVFARHELKTAREAAKSWSCRYEMAPRQMRFSAATLFRGGKRNCEIQLFAHCDHSVSLLRKRWRIMTCFVGYLRYVTDDREGQSLEGGRERMRMAECHLETRKHVVAAVPGRRRRHAVQVQHAERSSLNGS